MNADVDGEELEGAHGALGVIALSWEAAAIGAEKDQLFAVGLAPQAVILDVSGGFGGGRRGHVGFSDVEVDRDAMHGAEFQAARLTKGPWQMHMQAGAHDLVLRDAEALVHGAFVTLQQGDAGGEPGHHGDGSKQR